MKRLRDGVLLSLTAVVIACVISRGLLQDLIPTVYAFPQPPTGNTGAPGDGNCMGCHSGSAAGGSVVVNFPSGLTYTPGVTQHLSVKVNDATHSAWSFQLTARLASNTSTQAGSFTATDTANTTVQTSGSIQDMETTSGGIGVSTWSFDWIPPSSNVGNVIFYVTGMGAGSPGGLTSGNGIYNASYTLMPAAPAPPPASPTLSATPKTMTFNYQSGGATPPSQQVMVSSSSTALNYTVAATPVAWLSANPTSGTTPGSVSVSVNPTGLAPGMFKGTVTITSAGATGSPQVVNVTLTVTAAPAPVNSSLTVTPTSLQFKYQSGGALPPSQTLMVSSGTQLTYSVSPSGGSWLAATPTNGNTPGTIGVSVNAVGLSPGSYSGQIQLSATGNISSKVPVTLTVTAGTSGGGGGSQQTQLQLYVKPYVYDTSSSWTLVARWVAGLGLPQGGTGGYPGLVLSKNASAPTGSVAGGVIKNAQGLSLTELGFDYRDGGQCTATSPRFVVVTTDNVVHTVGGCSNGNIQNAPLVGWKRVRFNLNDPKQTNPPITPGQQVEKLSILLDQGPEAGAGAAGGLVVLDNVDINGTLLRGTSGSGGHHRRDD